MTHDENDPPPLESQSQKPREPLAPLEAADFAAYSTPPLSRPRASRHPERPSPVDRTASVSEDLRVPWGWRDILLLIGVAAVATVAIQLILVAGFLCCEAFRFRAFRIIQAAWRWSPPSRLKS